MLVRPCIKADCWGNDPANTHEMDLGRRKAGKSAGVRGEEIQYSNNDTLHLDDDALQSMPEMKLRDQIYGGGRLL